MKNFFNVRFRSADLWLLPLMLVVIILGCTGCSDDDDPEKEDTPEMITRVTLTFTPSGGGAAITASAIDPDGDGLEDLVTDGPIELSANTTYSLSITLINELATPGTESYDVTSEVQDEGDEHLFFFSWSEGVFSNPAGNGNIDNGNDPLNYADQDEDGEPIGLKSTWTTGESASGQFRLILKHQPDLKSTDVNNGETDLDVEFEISVAE